MRRVRHQWGRRLLGMLAILAPVAVGAQAGPAFEDSMAQRMQACTVCHGAQGRAAPDGYYPRIAGKPAGYLFNQLRNFRDGRRHYGLMAGMVERLDDTYLREIAGYFSALDLPYPRPRVVPVSASEQQRGEGLVLRGDDARRLPACTSCHGARLTGVAPNVPGLLGLPRDYLNAQIGAWKTGQRRTEGPDCMAAITRQLGGDEVSAISAWLASQPLPVPAAPAAAPAPRGPGAPACGSAPELGGPAG